MKRLSRRSAMALGGAALLGTGAAFGLLWPRAGTSGGATMTPAEAHAAAGAGEILLVDIRRPDEWAKTGVPEVAEALDMRDSAFVDKVLAARRSDDQPVAVICARGVRSARLARRMTDAGITPVIDVPEGMLGSGAGPGWLARGLPLKQVS